jgi:hypothetical protein
MLKEKLDEAADEGKLDTVKLLWISSGPGKN